MIRHGDLRDCALLAHRSPIPELMANAAMTTELVCRPVFSLPHNDIVGSRALEPRYGVTRHRHSAAMTPPRAWSRGSIAARIIEVHYGTAH